MKTHKVTECIYTDKKGKARRGLWLLNRNTNTAVMLDKNFNRVNINDCSNIVTEESTEGCIYFNLNRH